MSFKQDLKEVPFPESILNSIVSHLKERLPKENPNVRINAKGKGLTIFLNHEGKDYFAASIKEEGPKKILFRKVARNEKGSLCQKSRYMIYMYDTPSSVLEECRESLLLASLKTSSKPISVESGKQKLAPAITRSPCRLHNLPFDIGLIGKPYEEVTKILVERKKEQPAQAAKSGNDIGKEQNHGQKEQPKKAGSKFRAGPVEIPAYSEVFVEENIHYLSFEMIKAIIPMLKHDGAVYYPDHPVNCRWDMVNGRYYLPFAELEGLLELGVPCLILSTSSKSSKNVWAEKSILMLYGYSVESNKYGFAKVPSPRRKRILSFLIETPQIDITAERVCSYLRHFISLFKSPSYDNARLRWLDDLSYVANKYKVRY